ncbi:helix-turn-helix transcriptional regulator [Dechloromonas sp. ZY10]|uniref:LuxR C-terminal-related transcriptional regulator n=1 Tax=Dechloromonas aquae TaxID=2664436 RepID=UPI003526CAE8
MAELPLDDAPELSPRQRQILDLLRVGKVNKEIANELGIGLGTVKQHIVAIFKKLKVRNRAAAVSCDLQRGQTESEAPVFATGLLERRPCVVLSLLLAPEQGGEGGEHQALMRLLHQSLAAYAFDHDAVFLARHQCAGDLIFGIRSACTQDVYRAVLAARLVYRAVAASDGRLAQGLRGAITAGLAVVSINRRGAWSGEAMASSAIADARDMAASGSAGGLQLSPQARAILNALGPVPLGPETDCLHFSTVDHLVWQEIGGDPPVASGLLGRSRELRQIAAWLAQSLLRRRGLFLLEGEIGMGKSTLCRRIAHEGWSRGWRLRHFFALHDLDGPSLRQLPEGLPVAPQSVCDEPAGLPTDVPEILLIDDANLLPGPVLASLVEACIRQGRLLLLAGRRFPESIGNPDAALRLGRLAPEATAALLQAAATRYAAEAAALGGRQISWGELAEMACGVPLFACEMARANLHEPGAGLTLALRLAIAARLDPMGLDRLLLRQVARSEGESAGCREGAELAGKIGVSAEVLSIQIEQAVSAGVLRRGDQGRLAFVHPLLRQAILQSEIS